MGNQDVLRAIVSQIQVWYRVVIAMPQEYREGTDLSATVGLVAGRAAWSLALERVLYRS